MYQLVDSMRSEFAVEKICDALPVAKSGYYKWKKNPVSKREESDLVLLEFITGIHFRSRERFGSPQILNKLNEMGEFPNHKRVERIMRNNGIRSKAAKKFKVTTNSDHDKNISPIFCEEISNHQQKTTYGLRISPTFELLKGGFTLLSLLIYFQERLLDGACQKQCLERL